MSAFDGLRDRDDPGLSGLALLDRLAITGAAVEVVTRRPPLSLVQAALRVSLTAAVMALLYAVLVITWVT